MDKLVELNLAKKRYKTLLQKAQKRKEEFMFGTNLNCNQHPKAGYET
jgi:hypothetical protein